MKTVPKVAVTPMKQLTQILTLLFLFLFGLTQTASAHEGPHITVQPGDSLSEIAQRNNTDVATLRRLNNLESADSIRIGALLALPGVEEATAPLEDVVPDQPSNSVRYIVQAGDTLSEIARQHGIPLAWLVDTNRISLAQTLTINQELWIPNKQSSTKEPLVIEHIVQNGEHLGSIAQQYGLSVAELVLKNRLSNSNLIAPGQRLLIGDTDALDERFVAQEQERRERLIQSIGLFESPPITEKWIDVDLGNQTVTAYEGAVPVNHFIISSGLPGTPTVTGEFRIWAKTSIQDMYGGNRASGDYYYLEDVQWVQYFFEDYAFHATYWHNNFGQPMSRGCINMRTEDAKWLFDWASPQSLYSGWLMSDATNPGTLVIVHE